MVKDSTIRKYCVGCGLCKSAVGCKMSEGENGYMELGGLKPEDKAFIDNVCPMSEVSLKRLSTDDIWGSRLETHFAWSSDDTIRKNASSGGVLTAICIYLLKENLVDGIVHVKVSDESPIRNVVHISTTEADILQSMGSRYSPSSPLADILQIVDTDKKYAFIGKPCDVTALSNYIEQNEEYKKVFPYLLSFFCAGLPSRKANESLLKSLGTDENSSCQLTYRGNGWPGETTAVDEKGQHAMTYENAWGKILGRDIHPFCRFCMDGIGERADISCGDGWYQDETGAPSFEEAQGRNIVFIRSETGRTLYDSAVKAGYIVSEAGVTDDYLAKIQKYQFSRKSCMQFKMLAHRLMLNAAPYRNIKMVSAFSKEVSLKEKVKIFKGTVKRILQKKI